VSEDNASQPSLVDKICVPNPVTTAATEYLMMTMMSLFQGDVLNCYII
jgi:hypothetical protein